MSDMRLVTQGSNARIVDALEFFHFEPGDALDRFADRFQGPSDKTGWVALIFCTDLPITTLGIGIYPGVPGSMANLEL